MNQKIPKFLYLFQKEGENLYLKQALLEPHFSRGTYQFEVIETIENKKKKSFPFIQISDAGEVIDCFCSCQTSEEGNGCPHLAASYLQIFNGFQEPLHVRFRKSLWNRLFQVKSRRCGYDAGSIKKREDGVYYCESKTKKLLFLIETRQPKAKKRLEKIVIGKPLETEETSIKFSNLPIEEIEAFRKKKASHQLLYELSFWSDLAKWFMHLQEKKEPYEIIFSDETVPQCITVRFLELEAKFYIAQAIWPWIIPSLSTVHSPLKVFDEGDDGLESVVYDEKAKSLLLKHKVNGKKVFIEQGIALGEWLFVRNEGFYRKRRDPFLEAEVIPEEKIAEALSRFSQLFSSFLPIFPEEKSAQYFLHFDEEANLHIELFVFEPKDLFSERAGCFVPWVYLPDQGFFLLKDWLFEGKEKIVLKKDMAEFINRHRLWLHSFPGFQTHLGSLESHLIFRLREDLSLIFQAELNFPQDYEDCIHFDEWVYIKGEGFYMKKETRNRLPIHPGLEVKKEEISSFIHSHKEELRQVGGFFSVEPFILKSALHIALNEEGRIFISPQLEYAPGVHPKDLLSFGDYSYLEGKGFSEVPPSVRLPERYQKPIVIAENAETAFLAFELEPLKPYISHIDPRIEEALHLRLKIRKIAPNKRKRGREWLLDLIYTSDTGSVSIFSIWDAFQQKKRHLFSSAGLLHLKDPRFHWIRQLNAKRLDRKKGIIRLSTLEWIRLIIFEPVEAPQDEETREFLKELNELQTSEILDISKLQATLRPYQETGLNWLWFLYCHGLSGLLCDDMGLGKTHQAMALLAAISYADERKENKYLVVCPTSVIYHWQELLKRFLPEIRVSTYYGLERNLQDFEEHFDLLLTSYGILRSGKDEIRSLRFEVAVFDEIQIAKNHTSQTHKALKVIRSQMKLGLTGTPIENRLQELKSLFDIVLPSYMPPDPIFREAFVHPIEKNQDAEKKALLTQLVKPFILRRKKSEVLTDLPEKIEEIAYCDLSQEQKEQYREIALQMKETLYQDLQDQSKPISFLHVFSALSQLKRICDHPALFLGTFKQFQSHESGKWDLFVELLNEARESNQKVVVFSQYLEMLAIIELYLKKKGIGYAGIKGSTRDRSEQLRRFREDPQCEVFVASLLAAGVGIDLTVASIVIHYDRWWNPAKENQATDRVHRIGQNRGVQVFKLVTKNTIEEHIHSLIEKKKSLLEDIIGTEDQITYLTREELLEIFSKMTLI